MNHLSKPQDPEFSDETLDAAFAKLDDGLKVETVDLANYFHSPDPFSCGFNWRSIALTLQAWNRLSDDHYAILMTTSDPENPDPQVLTLNYRQTDLWIPQGLSVVVWHGPGKVLSADPKRTGINTSTELPVDAVDLLRALGMTSDSHADEVIQLWDDLMDLLPTLGID
jgi:hypothetical protein